MSNTFKEEAEKTLREMQFCDIENMNRREHLDTALSRLTTLHEEEVKEAYNNGVVDYANAHKEMLEDIHQDEQRTNLRGVNK